ncbi:MAG: hypothetical protein LAN64_01635 [Acidobacteriia bacterium]|nr:hypothetical protein [Terriglobia bacterium]
MFDSRQDSIASPNNNWPSPSPGGTTTGGYDSDAAKFKDGFCAADSSLNPASFTPFAGSSQLVFTIHQTWYSGSATPGQGGVIVNYENIQYFNNYATVSQTSH